MCTTFSDLAIRYNQDLVCLLDRGKAVCDGDDGFPSGKFCYGILDQMFIFRVNTCGRLIQNNDGLIFQNSTCNGDPLFLAAGEGVSAFSKHCVISVRQIHDKIVAAGFF